MRSMTFCNTGLKASNSNVIMDSHAENTKRIAKNTLMLYIRMLFGMVVSLFTSRVVLDALGVEDYGIYNVVGGVVAMFSLLSTALSTSISRFVTFEIGKGDEYNLKKVFTSSVAVMFALSIGIFIVAEIVGVWFLNTHLNIPVQRLEAANWVLQCAILAFAVDLNSVPYTSAIIAHERMSAFAYLGILNITLRLVVVYALYVSCFDKLMTYSVLTLSVSILMCLIDYIYCRRNFVECAFRIIYDKSLLKKMLSFAGWSFLGNGAYLLNTQGVNILMNMFFGVAVNAARGVAGQVDGAVQSFVANFTTAMNPQIIKSYAAGDLNYMHTLVCRGAKYSYFMTFFFAVPLVLEAQQVLSIWLVEVPEHAVMFVRLTLLSSLAVVVANTLFTAQLATGKIKKYQITVTLFGIWVLPLSYLFFKLGFPPEIAYIVYFAIYFGLIFVRIYLVKDLIKMPWMKYVKEVLLRMGLVSVCSVILPCLVYFNMPSSFIRLLVVCMVSALSSAAFMYFLGLEKGERTFVISKIQNKIHLFKH